MAEEKPLKPLGGKEEKYDGMRQNCNKSHNGRELKNTITDGLHDMPGVGNDANTDCYATVQKELLSYSEDKDVI